MINLDTLATYAGPGMIGLAGAALGLQQVIKRWKANNAETAVLTLLHNELNRMSTQNTELSKIVNTLQLEANKINLQLGKLQLENQKLHAEVVCLTNEVIKLRSAFPGGDI